MSGSWVLEAYKPRHCIRPHSPAQRGMDAGFIFALVMAGCFGAFVGSFLNVCVHRLPRNESVVHPRSRCYGCGTAVAWYDNLPLVSWLVLGGRCRWCGSPFSVRYWLMELGVGLLTAAIVAWAWWSVHRGLGPPALGLWSAWFGFGAIALQWQVLEVRSQLAALDPAAPGASELVGRLEAVLAGLDQQLAATWPVEVLIIAAVTLLVVYVLLVGGLIDLAHRILPDELSLPLQALAPFLAVAIASGLHLGWEPYAWFVATADGRPLPAVGAGLTITGLVVAGAGLLLLVSLPLMRWVYGTRVARGQGWSEEDHRSRALAVRFFLVSLMPAAAACVVCAWLGSGGLAPGADNLLASAQLWTAVHLANALLGAMAGWWLPYLVGVVGTAIWRQDAMGFGDVKLMAWIGALVGPIGVLLVFFIAAWLGSVIGIALRLVGGGEKIPFAPYLMAGAVAVLLFGADIAGLFGRMIH